MLLQVSAFLPLVSLVLSSAIPSNLPAFCHELDCPQFTVLESTADYKLRHYDATKWVSVQKEAATLDDVSSGMFHLLFLYISGENANHANIPMTAPVLTTLAHGQDPNCARNFTMHFMLPHDQWQAPIQPTDPHVKVVTLPPMDVYEFRCLGQDEDYTAVVMELYTTLSAKHVNVNTSVYYHAGYDGPYQFAERHNEVWIRKV